MFQMRNIFLHASTLSVDFKNLQVKKLFDKSFRSLYSDHSAFADGTRNYASSCFFISKCLYGCFGKHGI